MASCGKVSATWKAPAEDGEILIWPEAMELLARAREDHKRLGASEIAVGGVALRELRRWQRQWVGHEEDSPLVAAGHQIELLHPGVWAKDVLINELARKLDGAAYHFAVDTDGPKHLQLRWPPWRGAGGAALPITDDPQANNAAWAGLLAAPTEEHIRRMEEALGEAANAWNFTPMAGEFLASLHQASGESENLTWALTNAIHHLDLGLGLKHHALLLAPMWSSAGYLLFVHHVLSRAESFAAAYNGILAEYRRETGIRSEGRPWPDLKVTAERCEAPFWLDWVDEGRRERACVTRVGGMWRLRLGEGREFELDEKQGGWETAEKLGWFLAMNKARLSPRALTLTAFLRLAVVDQFVHGIGGGRYDCVTDRMIERWFGLEAPAFSVTTATLLFPGAVGMKRVRVDELLREGRKLRHGDAGEEKMRMVREIENLPRRSPERQRSFYDMHRRLKEAVHGLEYRAWAGRLDEARELARAQEQLFDRELFYGIQPEERLRRLIDTYAQRLRG